MALEMAEEIRDLFAQADRARVLARGCNDKTVCSNLNRYAAELDAEAEKLKDTCDSDTPPRPRL